METAKQLAESALPDKKRIIVIHGRSDEKLIKAKETIHEHAKQNTENFKIFEFKADISDINQVKVLANHLLDFKNKYECALDVLILNAAIMD